MGLGIADDQYRWPNRTIPYEIDPAFPHAQRVLDAMAHWHEHTSIRFVERSGEADYVRITPQAGSALSAIGRREGRQDISLGDSCTVGTIVHELCHAVGLCHEHCRGDRKHWIEVDESNILDEYLNQFLPDSIDGAPATLLPLGSYDYGSITHYSTDTFVKDKREPVITTLQPRGAAIGQRDGLSPGDIAAVELLYKDVPRPDDAAGAPTIDIISAQPAPEPAPPARMPAPQPVPVATRAARPAPRGIWSAVIGFFGRWSKKAQAPMG